jgi:hypothetical protein
MHASSQTARLRSCLTTSFSTRAARSACRQPALVSAALGAPTGRYIAPANSNGCIQAFPGQCGFANLILEGPRFVRFDMSLVKKIRFSERTNIEFRVELLNAFNNINFLVGGSSAVDDPKLTGDQSGFANAELWRRKLWIDHRRLPGYFDDQRSRRAAGAVCF